MKLFQLYLNYIRPRRSTSSKCTPHLGFGLVHDEMGGNQLLLHRVHCQGLKGVGSQQVRNVVFSKDRHCRHAIAVHLCASLSVAHLDPPPVGQQASSLPHRPDRQFTRQAAGQRGVGRAGVHRGFYVLAALAVRAGNPQSWSGSRPNTLDLTPNPPMGGVKAGQIGIREPAREKAWAPLGPM